MNIAKLLGPSAKLESLADAVRAAAAELSAPGQKPVPYRMTEGNTCYHGGKPGVSDVFAAALWAADYCLRLAAYGYAGVNLQGGAGKAVANSVGGTLPGEALLSDPSVPHPRPFYTPIAEMDGRYVAEPVYMGMQFAQQFAGARMMKVDFAPRDVNATAYAGVMKNGSKRVAIINKDAARAITVSIGAMAGACTEALTSPALDSRRVHFSAWPGAGSKCKASGSGDGVFTVPAASALLIKSH